jgi:hypothetical protein
VAGRSHSDVILFLSYSKLVYMLWMPNLAQTIWNPARVEFENFWQYSLQTSFDFHFGFDFQIDVCDRVLN